MSVHANHMTNIASTVTRVVDDGRNVDDMSNGQNDRDLLHSESIPIIENHETIDDIDMVKVLGTVGSEGDEGISNKQLSSERVSKENECNKVEINHQAQESNDGLGASETNVLSMKSLEKETDDIAQNDTDIVDQNQEMPPAVTEVERHEEGGTCSCGARGDPLQGTIQCTFCSVFYHYQCIGLLEGAASALKEYKCAQCRLDMGRLKVKTANTGSTGIVGIAGLHRQLEPGQQSQISQSGLPLNNRL